jgi:hypothetical protein
LKSLKNVLGKPAPESYPWAIWNWNGTITPEKIATQFKGFVDALFSGIIIRPSSDMSPGYLSDEFLAFIEHVVALAKEHSLQLRIYDDLTLKKSTLFAASINQSVKLRAQRLVLEQSITPSEHDDLTLNIENPETAIVLAVKVSDHQINIADTKQLTVKPDKNNIVWKAQAGEWRLIILRKQFVYDSGSNFLPNLLNGKTVSIFSQLVLDPLKTLLEASGAVFSGFVTSIPSINPSDNGIPWDDDLIASYKTLFKKDLIKLLPAFFFENCTQSQKIRQQFYTFIFDSVNNNFIAPLEAWLKKNHLSTWILFSDLSKRIVSNELDGEMISTGCASQICGLDSNKNITENQEALRLFANSRTLERKGEYVSIIGHNQTNTSSMLQHFKRDVDLVTTITPCTIAFDGFFVNPEYQASLCSSVNTFTYSPEWRFMRDLCKYTAHVKELVKNVAWTKQALVLSPLTEMLSDYFPNNNAYSRKGYELFSKTIAMLDRLSISYDCVSDNYLASCEIGENGGIISTHSSGIQTCNAIIIPFAPLISKAILSFIEKAVQKNVNVFFIDEVPKGTIEDGIAPAITGRIMKLLDPKKNHVSIVKSDSPDSSLGEIETSFFTIANSHRDSDILVSFGKSENFDIYMMHNTSEDKDQVIHVTMPDYKHFSIADMESGEIFELENIERDSGTAFFDICFMPAETFIILGSSAKIANAVFEKFTKTGVNPFTLFHRCYRIIFKAQWNFTTPSLNSLPLGNWSMRMGLSRDSGIFSHFYESNFHIKTQLSTCFLALNDNQLFNPDTLTYDPGIEILINGIKIDKHLCCSLPPADNGTEPQRSDFGIPDIDLNQIFSRHATVYNIASLLVNGGNRISIRTTSRNPSPQSMYLPPQLLGDFTIIKDKSGLILDKTPIVAGYGSWTRYGFPFLCGKGVYSQTFEVPNEYEKIILRFLQVSGSLQVRINGKNLGVINWHPFELDITAHCIPKRNEIEICVVNSADNVLRMSSQASGLIGEVFLDVY